MDAFSPDHERAWAKIAEERLRGIREDEKKAIPAEEVFTKARNLIGE
jgi:Putative addiction module component